MPARISRSRIAVAMFCAALLAGADSANTQIADTPDLETMASAAQISIQVGADLDESFFSERRLDAVRITRIVGGGADAL